MSICIIAFVDLYPRNDGNFHYCAVLKRCLFATLDVSQIFSFIRKTVLQLFFLLWQIWTEYRLRTSSGYHKNQIIRIKWIHWIWYWLMNPLLYSYVVFSWTLSIRFIFILLQSLLKCILSKFKFHVEHYFVNIFHHHKWTCFQLVCATMSSIFLLFGVFSIWFKSLSLSAEDGLTFWSIIKAVTLNCVSITFT